MPKNPLNPITPTEKAAKPVTEAMFVTPKKRRPWLRFFGLLFLVLVVTGVVYYYKLKDRIVVAREGDLPSALAAANLGQLDPNQLIKDGDARINVVILGKGGTGHAGGQLTDSIQLLSVDPFNDEASIIGIPRDMYVKTENGPMKINAVYSHAEGAAKGTGGAAVKKVIGEIADLDIHYFALIDFNGLISLVDTLDGIEVTVDKTLHDTAYPVGDGSDEVTTFHIEAGTHTMDGETALKFTRSRQSTSDFDRLNRQQKVITAIKAKALESGIMTNPVKVGQIIEDLSRNFQTDISPKEIRLIFDRIGSMKEDQIQSAVIGNGGFGSTVLLEGERDPNLGSVQIPLAGKTNYKDIQRLIHQISPDPLIKLENSVIEIKYDPSTKAKTDAQDLYNLLKDYGYNVSEPAAMSEDLPKNNSLYDYHKKSPFTLNYLTHRLELTAESKKAPNDTADIGIILVK